ncbi:MAG: sugar phosphate nucleotidyltransferase [Candidatus Omnitrophica bacterium]|nr:sugar phosphate nucleotidyltransferase [Candidatus Omnitrophota bacterium]
MTEHNYAVLLSGGKGTRFWPQSRLLTPKQFLPLIDNKTLFEHTLNRVKPLFKPEHIFISTLESYRKQTFKYIAPFGIPRDNVICEPESKNTAPSIAVSAHLIHNKDPEAKICVLPCDHLIRNNKVFLKLLVMALGACENNLIVFGIKPSRPATGYGYIKIKTQGVKGKAKNAYLVDKFVEKPHLKTALRLYKDRRYFWNSGMFAGKAASFLKETEKCQPELFKQVSKIKKSTGLKKAWKQIGFISFDYAILEKTKKLFMLAAQDLGWSDLGGWQAYDDFLAKDGQGNHFSNGAFDIGSRNTTVLSGGRLVATIGLDDIIIVGTKDALLVAKKGRSEEIKRIVELLKNKKRPEL